MRVAGASSIHSFAVEPHHEPHNISALRLEQPPRLKLLPHSEVADLIYLSKADEIARIGGDVSRDASRGVARRRVVF